MRRALAEEFASVEGVRVVMMLDAILPDEPGHWEVVRVGPGGELATFRRLAASSDFTLLIAPESDGLLLERAKSIEMAGGRSLGSRLAAMALCGDKLLLGRWLETRGIPTPRSVVIGPNGRLPAEFPYPAVLKPIDGAGALDTFAIGRADRPPVGISTGKSMLLQPYVAGEPMSAAFLVGIDGIARLVGVGRQQIEVRGGRFSYLGGTIPAEPEPPLDAVREAVASVKGLRGWVGVDFVWQAATGKITVLEINPRATTSFVGYRRLLAPGALARAWLAAMQDPGGYDWNSLESEISQAHPIAFEADGHVSDVVGASR